MTQQRPFRLLDLPPEIRENIYRQLLHPAVNRTKNAESYVKYRYDLSIFRASRQVYYESRRIFRALNHFVAIETPWPQAQHHVEQEGYLPVLLHGDRAAAFTGHVMLVSIDAPQFNVFTQPCTRFVAHADDMAVFADMWHYQDLSHPNLNLHLRLTLTLRTPFPASGEAGEEEAGDGAGPGPGEGDSAGAAASEARTLPREPQERLIRPSRAVKYRAGEDGVEEGGAGAREGAGTAASEGAGTTASKARPLPRELQERLIRPFGAVKHLAGVNVEGPHDAAVVQAMRDDMARPYRAAEDCLDEATALKEAGNAALKRGDNREAIRLYEASFRAIHIICDGRRRSVWGDAFFNREMLSGRHKGQHGNLVRLVLRVKLVSNIVFAFVRLEEWDWAWFWGKRTINLMRGQMDDEAEEPLLDFPAANELGKIYYRTGLAGKHLADPAAQAEARTLLKVAIAYLPNDPQVQQEVQTL